MIFVGISLDKVADLFHVPAELSCNIFTPRFEKTSTKQSSKVSANNVSSMIKLLPSYSNNYNLTIPT